jgi:hypothetical protein
LIAALCGLGLLGVVPACGTDATSEGSALLAERIDAPPVVQGPDSVDLYNVDGVWSTDSSAGTDPNTTPTPPAMCFTQTEEDKTCGKNEAAWKSAGTMYCASKKASLHNITFTESCGRGYYRKATYECCAMTTPPPPPPPMCGCTTEKAGGPKDCRDRKDWKSEGEKVCKSKGKVLNKIEYRDSCGCDSFRNVEFECCSSPTPPPPPPPPPSCIDQHLGGPMMPMCETEASFKMTATAACGRAMLKLGAFSVGGAPCVTRAGAKGFSEAKFQCCK